MIIANLEAIVAGQPGVTKKKNVLKYNVKKNV